METTPIDSLELAGLFRYASRLLARAHHGRCHGDRAQHAQGRLLALIRENGPVSQGDLLRFMDVRSSSLSELLAKLERRGLVRRERNPDDRRGFIVSATEEADGLLAERDKDERSLAEDLFSCLDDGEKQALRAILLKIADSLGDGPEDQPDQGLLVRGRRWGLGLGMRGGKGRGGRGGRR